MILTPESLFFIILILTNMDAIKQRYLSLLAEVERPGIDNLLNFVVDNCPLSLMVHSVKVFDHMMSENTAMIPRESVIITALCHDLGKITIAKTGAGYDSHPQESISVLESCGVELTENEREVIMGHHESAGDIVAWFDMLLNSPLMIMLQVADFKNP